MYAVRYDLVFMVSSIAGRLIAGRFGRVSVKKITTPVMKAAAEATEAVMQGTIVYHETTIPIVPPIMAYPR